jgi:N-acetylglutamate synthase-like GNAT family acetyltransferase
MRVRKALPQDTPLSVDLARGLDLAYDGMEADELWVAGDDRGRIVGVVALKTHPDCLELCALGVDPGCRGQGIARELVEALLASAPGDVHLATVIPGLFEACGFHIIKEDIPATFPAKRLTAWCDGCPRERCTVMIRKRA